MLFVQNETSVVTIILSNEGNAVTGLDASDVRCFVAKDGSSPPTEYNLTGRINEVSPSVMPGIYSIELLGTEVFDQEGEVILRFFESATPLAPFDAYLVKGQVYSTNLSGLDTTTLSVQNTVESNQTTLSVVNLNVNDLATELDEAKGVGFATGTDSLRAQRSVFDDRVPSEVAKVTDLENAGLDQAAPTGVGLWDVLGDGSVSMVDVGDFLRRVLGLVHENFVITNQSYDPNNNLLGATVKIYDTASDAQDDVDEIAAYVIEATYDGGGRLIDYKMLRDD